MDKIKKMTVKERVDKVFLDVLSKIPNKEYFVPTILGEIDPDIEIEKAYGFDRFDWLELFLALGKEFGIKIFANEYFMFLKLRDFYDYFEAKV